MIHLCWQHMRRCKNVKNRIGSDCRVEPHSNQRLNWILLFIYAIKIIVYFLRAICCCSDCTDFFQSCSALFLLTHIVVCFIWCCFSFFLLLMCVVPCPRYFFLFFFRCPLGLGIYEILHLYSLHPIHLVCYVCLLLIFGVADSFVRRLRCTRQR